ncbi:sensor histidine kinase [Paenibacillus sp. PDC88]|uniref:sensor histidine kinase n=1 Tax=Paenibacillus sp. PDC88 TaxID=1884375 RepID=UPI0008979E2F|nr:histidine kinase [Paenibacillus sp. PDC88]SDW73914.1 two-component system, NarL family, nitrate/nitrite sensor histidine kinase NarQ [Paenibacillus sp. PDC88]
MKYKQIKWMILFIPTFVVGLWEYVRHQFLLPYISMELGNWLTPIILYMVSITLLNKLFHILEKNQRELEKARSIKAVLEERENLARELHDGIAQSLFLLSVKIDLLEGNDSLKDKKEVYQVRKTVHEVNRYVRQAIADLRQESVSADKHLERETITMKLNTMAQQSFVNLHVEWSIPEDSFTMKEKVELLACIREAVSNIEKHAGASKGWITGQMSDHGWEVTITDNGQGFEGDPFQYIDRYGLSIMRERASALDWKMSLERTDQNTSVHLMKVRINHD